MISIDFTDSRQLVSKIEYVPHVCVNIYGRVSDDKKWTEPMNELTVYSEVGNHPTQDEMDKYHPTGSPRKIGYQHIHHIHIVWDADVKNKLYKALRGRLALLDIARVLTILKITQEIY